MGTRNYIFHFLFYTKLYCGGAAYKFYISNIFKKTVTLAL